MALIKCSECKKEISNEAKKCPNCGYPMKNSGSTSFVAKIAEYKFYLASIVLIGIAAYAVWSTTPSRLLIGTWDEIDGSEIVTFSSDNRFTTTGGGIGYGGNYELIEDGQLRTTAGGIIGTTIYEYEVSYDRLTLSYDTPSYSGSPNIRYTDTKSTTEYKRISKGPILVAFYKSIKDLFK